MSARTRFVQLALDKLGSTVLWGKDGPDVFDCSGLVCWSLLAVGGPDLRDTHRAQDLSDETPDLLTANGSAPMAGDLCFYGDSPGHVSHVAIWLEGGKCLSADGATSRITTLKEARAKPSCRVRLHELADFRKDLRHFAIHRNTFLNAVDLVCK